MTDVIRIKPKEDYKLLSAGGWCRLRKDTVYKAIPATNQPKYKELGLVFAGRILLSRDEYVVCGK